MDKNDSMVPQKKKEKNQSVIIISLLITAIFLIVDLYVMINMPNNLAALIIVTALFLSGVYFFINAILKEMEKSRLRAEEQSEVVIKSGKASYLLMKKAFAQKDEKSDRKVTTTDSSENVITAQKALAKVIINRSKENADAVMNSNDRILEKIFELENRMEMHQNDLSDLHRSMMNDCVKEMMQAQQEILLNMKELESSVKNEILDTMNSMQAMLEQQTVSIQQLKMSEDSLAEKMSSFEKPFMPEELEVESSSMSEDFKLSEASLVDDVGFKEAGFTEDLDFGEPEVTEDFNIEESGLTEGLDFGEPETTGDFNIGEPDFTENLDFGESEVTGDFNIGEPDFTENLDFGEPKVTGDFNIGETSLVESLDFEEPGNTEDFNIGESSLTESLDFGEPTEEFSEGELSLTEGLDFDEPGVTEDFNLGEFGMEENLDLGENSSLGETTVVEEISNLMEELNLNDKGDIKESIAATSTVPSENLDFEMDQLLKELQLDEELIEEPESEEIAEPLTESIEEPESVEIKESDTEPIVESVKEPEPVVQEIPNLSDPHKLMTPEEIAALIANM